MAEACIQEMVDINHWPEFNVQFKENYKSNIVSVTNVKVTRLHVTIGGFFIMVGGRDVWFKCKCEGDDSTMWLAKYCHKNKLAIDLRAHPIRFKHYQVYQMQTHGNTND